MVAEKIRLIRVSKGITQDFMALGLKISQPAYSKIENDKTKISFNMLQEIAPLLGCKTSEVLNYGDNDILLKKIDALELRIAALESILKK